MFKTGTWGAALYCAILITSAWTGDAFGASHNTTTMRTVSLPGTDNPHYVRTGEQTRAPIGWVEFCKATPDDCADQTGPARDIVLSPQTFRDLARVNSWANASIKPLTDLDHWGVVEKWSYPTDGYGDCEDYVLLKRKTLIEAGWPRAALLITVVRDKRGDGHAVLTVKTDRGEFVLDSLHDDILPWTATGYTFVKRQSQSDPNIWITLEDSRPATATASAKQ